MNIAYFDLIAGASGDMILGALLDSGLSLDDLLGDLATLSLSDFRIEVTKVNKRGFQATKVKVVVENDVPERHLEDIEAIIERGDLPGNIRHQALAMFRKLALVESGIHGTSPEKIHLHELGGVDTIIDIVGTLIGLDRLGIEKIFASRVPLGRGFIQGAHGSIPLPAPATVALLEGVPIIGSPVDKELVTPTGALLLSSLVESFGHIPPMKLGRVGYGAGERDLQIPNVLRILIGETENVPTSELVLLETNIDDLNPEIYDYVMEKLFVSKALDVYLIPIQMKKNRPAILLGVLCNHEDASQLRNIIFRETTTLGIRQQTVQRFALKREIKEVDTSYGKVRVKIAYFEDGKSRVSPEYEDCHKIAQKYHLAIQDVYKSVLNEVKNY